MTIVRSSSRVCPPSRVRPATFFAVTFILSWAIWIPLLMSHWNIGPIHVDEGANALIRLLGVLMPSITALLLNGLQDGRAGLKSLLGRLTIWRVGWGWWAAAVLVQPLLLLAAGWLYNVLGGDPPVVPVAGLSFAALVVQVIMLAIATVGEEIGWRGVALPGLQNRWSPVAASAILGLLWATWHMPFWLLIDTIPQFGAGYLAIDYLFVLAGTFYITWVFNQTRGSLLLPLGFHLSFNILNVALLPVTSSPGAFLLFSVLDLLIVIAIFARLAPKSASPENEPRATVLK